jgi:hypothetical protein
VACDTEQPGRAPAGCGRDTARDDARQEGHVFDVVKMCGHNGAQPSRSGTVSRVERRGQRVTSGETAVAGSDGDIGSGDGDNGGGTCAHSYAMLLHALYQRWRRRRERQQRRVHGTGPAPSPQGVGRPHGVSPFGGIVKARGPTEPPRLWLRAERHEFDVYRSGTRPGGTRAGGTRAGGTRAGGTRAGGTRAGGTRASSGGSSSSGSGGGDGGGGSGGGTAASRRAHSS